MFLSSTIPPLHFSLSLRQSGGAPGVHEGESWWVAQCGGGSQETLRKDQQEHRLPSPHCSNAGHPQETASIVCYYIRTNCARWDQDVSNGFLRNSYATYIIFLLPFYFSDRTKCSIIHKSKADKISDKFLAVFNTSDYLLVCSCLVPINWFQYVTCSSVNCSDLISLVNVTARLCSDV